MKESKTEQLIKDQLVDLTELYRQTQEYVIDLELELAEITNKWKYLKEEIEDKDYKEMEEK